MIMDMSASKRFKALSRISHIRGAGATTCCRLGPFEPRKPAKCRRSGSPRATVPNALLIAALSLSLAGCSFLQPGATVRTTPPPQTDTKGAQELTSAPKQPEAPLKPVPPTPQQPRRISETKPPSATGSRGAEKLAATSTPLTVRAREATTVKDEPVTPQAPITVGSGTVTDAPVAELVFKGPPHQAPPRMGARKMLAWFGLGLGVAVLAILARLYLIRRAQPPAVPDAKKDDLNMPKELLFKEPVNLPQEAVATEKS